MAEIKNVLAVLFRNADLKYGLISAGYRVEEIDHSLMMARKAANKVFEEELAKFGKRN